MTENAPTRGAFSLDGGGALVYRRSVSVAALRILVTCVAAALSMVAVAIAPAIVPHAVEAASGDCIVDRVVVDPDCVHDSLLPGLENSLAVDVFGAGGTFYVLVDDGGAGGAVVEGGGTATVADGTRLSFTYLAPSPLPADLKLAVTLEPRVSAVTCGGAARGATGTKTFPVPTVATSECKVTLRVTSAATIGSLQLGVDYSSSGADVAGCAESAVCTSAVAPVAGAVDHNHTAIMTVGLLAPFGFTTPADVLSCAFFAPARPVTGADFTISVVDAATPTGAHIAPVPRVSARIACAGVSTTTSTTLFEPPDVCGRPCSGAGADPKTTDALYVLRAALGLVDCEACVCDVDDSGAVTATDALEVLARAVGTGGALECAPCSVPVTTSCG